MDNKITLKTHIDEKLAINYPTNVTYQVSFSGKVVEGMLMSFMIVHE